MATTTNFGWETPDDTDLVKDGALAMRTLGNAIDTSLVDLKGGTTNQVLAKNSNTDMDFKWVADASGIPATIIDAKGDLIVGTAADTAGRLAVGTNGYVLTADSGETSGIKWAAASSGGQTVITTGSVPTNAATFTISSIPSSYNDLILVIDDIQYGSDEGLRLRMNGVTTSTYNSWFVTTNSNAISSSLAADNAYCQYLRNVADLRNIWYFPRYAQTGAAKTGWAVGSEVIPFGGFNNKSITAAIDSITIFNNGGNFTAGSYTLIGVK